MNTVGAILADKGGNVFTIAPRSTVLEAVEEMCARRVGALLVLREGAPIGMFSERDLMVRVVLARRDPASTAIEQVMTTDVVCVGPDTEAEEAMAIMTDRRCRHLPVVHEGHVVGMLSIGDLVRWMSDSQQFEIRMLRDYVAGKYPG